MPGPGRLSAFAAALLVMVVAGGGLYFRKANKPLPARFTLAPVERGDIVQLVATTGQLAPLVSVEVSTQTSGLVVEVNVDFNARVTRGQILAKIDPSSYEQRLRRAEADLEAARAVNELNEINSKRLQGLLREDLISQQDHDQAAAVLQQSRAVLLTRKAEVRNARVDLERCTIASPIDGLVIFKQIEVGKTIAASFNAPTLFVLAPDLSRLRIIAPINEVDVGYVHAGQDVSFTVDALPDHRFRGRLTQIRNPYTPSERRQETAAQQQGGITAFDAVIEVDNPELLLRPSLTASVSIVIASRRRVLRVPNGALRVDPPRDAVISPVRMVEASDPQFAVVYRQPKGAAAVHVEPVTVRLGISDSVMTEIVNGVNEGDQVVTGVTAEWTPPQQSLF